MDDEPRVLVVDDDDPIREMVKIAFELEGFAVATAANGLDAIVQTQLFDPDAVVMDIMMPRMDGLTALGHLRQQEATAELPVLLLTAKADSTDVMIGMRMGATDYVTKPFDADDLVERTRKAIDESAHVRQPGDRRRPSTPAPPSSREFTGIPTPPPPPPLASPRLASPPLAPPPLASPPLAPPPPGPPPTASPTADPPASAPAVATPAAAATAAADPPDPVPPAAPSLSAPSLSAPSLSTPPLEDRTRKLERMMASAPSEPFVFEPSGARSRIVDLGIAAAMVVVLVVVVLLLLTR